MSHNVHRATPAGPRRRAACCRRWRTGSSRRTTSTSCARGWAAAAGRAPVVGITGTGGAGKSTVTDELLSRFMQHFPELRVAVIAVDPTRRRTGGALLGDRIRMNSLRHERIYMRSVATRQSNRSTSAMLADAIEVLRSIGFDLVIVETAGTGQSDSEIVDLVDVPIYVMTSEFGAASQLEKIDMLDLAELVVINKFDKRGAQDALRDVRKQWRRNHVSFELADERIPVFPTVASQFADPGLTRLFVELCARLAAHAPAGASAESWQPGDRAARARAAAGGGLIPERRARYLAEIAEQGRAINADDRAQGGCSPRGPSTSSRPARALGEEDPAAAQRLAELHEEAMAELGAEAQRAARRLGGAHRGGHRRELQLPRPRP